jgi:hypothetical protein
MESLSHPFFDAVDKSPQHSLNEEDKNVAPKRTWKGEEQGPETKRRRVSVNFTPARVEMSELFCSMSEPVYSCVSAYSQSMQHLQQSPSMTKRILGVLSRSKTDVKLQLVGIRTLNACDDSTISDATEYIDAILNAIKAHPRCLLLQLEGCKALRRLVKMEESSSHLFVIGERGAVPVLLDALCHHSESLRLQYLGLNILRALSSCSSASRLFISQHATHLSSILNILETRLDDSIISQIGLSLLSWIVEDKSSRATVVQAGGISLVLKAMQHHLLDQCVQCNGSATLCWLIHTGGQEEARDAFLSTDTDGVGIILQAMSQYIDSPSVFGNCLCILSGACDADQVDGMETMRLAILGMQRHAQSSKVQRNGLTLLRLLTMMDRSGKQHEMFLHLSGLDTILAAMKLHSADAGIQTEACGVLANLVVCTTSTSTHKVKDVIAASDCMEAILNCQFEHKGNVRVQQAAIWFHNCMLQNADVGQEALAAFGGGVQVIDAMLLGIGVEQEQRQQQQQQQQLEE